MHLSQTWCGRLYYLKLGTSIYDLCHILTIWYWPSSIKYVSPWTLAENFNWLYQRSCRMQGHKKMMQIVSGFLFLRIHILGVLRDLVTPKLPRWMCRGGERCPRSTGFSVHTSLSLPWSDAWHVIEETRELTQPQPSDCNFTRDWPRTAQLSFFWNPDPQNCEIIIIIISSH